jgi:hypothetical protein
LVSFHIAGENGIGKTFATTLLAQAIFQYPDNEGFLIVSITRSENLLANSIDIRNKF